MRVLLLAIASASAFTPAGTPLRHSAAAARAPAPVAQDSFFSQLGKIADYNAKYFQTSISGIFDKRTARASHVLFGFAKYDNGEQEAANVKSMIESGQMSFADAAQKYSTCPSSTKGGDLGTFKKGAMVPEFDAICFDDQTPLGSGISMCKTQFGIHLIQVYERSAQ